MDSYTTIARYYDLEHDGFVDDIEFYLQYVQQEPVLEVGVGTGRVAEPLLEAGLEVWGVDTSESMLAVARRRLQRFPRAQLHLASVASLKLAAHFGTILMPLNVLWHVRELHEQIASLTTLRRHLLPGGTLIIDSTNPLSMADRGASGEIRQRFHYRRDDIEILGWSACWDDEAEQLLSLSLFYDETTLDGTLKRSSTSLHLRYFYRWELELLLEHAGFRVQQIYGSYNLEPYAATTPNLLIVATTS